MADGPSHTAGDTAEVLVLAGPRRLEQRALPLPDIGDDDGLLRVEACGLCGTDHEQYTGAHRRAGRVRPRPRGRRHRRARRRRAPPSGGASRRATASPSRCSSRAGTARPCGAGEYRRCGRHGIGDMYGFVAVSTPPALWGGYADPPVPRARLDAAARARRRSTRCWRPCSTRSAPGIRWGVDRAGHRSRRRGRRARPGHPRPVAPAPPPRRPAPAFVMLTGVGPRDHARLGGGPAFGADLTVDVTTRRPGRARCERPPAAWPTSSSTSRPRRPPRSAQAIAPRPSRRHGRGGRHARARPRRPGSGPTTSSTRSCASSACSASTTPAYRAALDLLATRPLPVRRPAPPGGRPRHASNRCCGRWPARATMPTSRCTPCSSRDGSRRHVPVGSPA